MKIVIEGSPEEIERVLRKLAPRPRRTQLQPPQCPFHFEPIVGPQVVDPITWPHGPYTYPSTGLPVRDGVAPLTVGEGVAPLTVGICETGIGGYEGPFTTNVVHIPRTFC